MRPRRLFVQWDLKFKKIHACKNDCILFHGDNVALTECPKCGTSRYKQRTDEGDDGKEMRYRVPWKVAWYFPIIPRLKHLFATSKDARHSDGQTVDDCVQHPADGIQWRVIDFKNQTFADEPSNLWFALSTDGMHPFGNMSS